MGLVKGAVAVAAVGAGAMAYMGLSRMDSGTIREYGDKVKDMVAKAGAAVSDTEIAADIKSKVAGTGFGNTALSVLDSAKGGISSGFDKFVDAIADAKEASERDGSSFAGNLFGQLSDAVSSAADFVSEHIPTAQNVGSGIVHHFLDKDTEAAYDTASVPAGTDGIEMDL